MLVSVKWALASKSWKWARVECGKLIFLRTEAAGCGLLSLPWAPLGLLFAFCGTEVSPSRA